MVCRVKDQTEVVGGGKGQTGVVGGVKGRAGKVGVVREGGLCQRMRSVHSPLP